MAETSGPLNMRSVVFSDHHVRAHVHETRTGQGPRQVFVRLVPRGTLPVQTVRGEAHVDLDADGNIMGVVLEW